VGRGAGGVTNEFTTTSSINGAGNIWLFDQVIFSGSLDVGRQAIINYGTVNFFGTNVLAASPIAIGSLGTANFKSSTPVLISNLELDGGVLTGIGPITITGLAILSSGTIGPCPSLTFSGRAMIVDGLPRGNQGVFIDDVVVNNAGTAIIDWTLSALADTQINNLPGATLTITNGGGIYMYYGNVTLNNSGTVTWSGGNIVTGAGSLIRNAQGGTLDITFDWQTFDGVGGSRSFVNEGLLRKTAGNGTNTITDDFQNTGTIEAQSGVLAFGGNFIQTAGTMKLNGGSVAAQNPFRFNGGSLIGNGVIYGSVINAAVCSPGSSPSRLEIDGDFTQTFSGQLAIELAGANASSGFDQLIVSGVADLAGALNVTSGNGFTPSPGDRFRILSFGSRSGDFTLFNDATGGRLSRMYDSNGMTLHASDAVLNVSRVGQQLILFWPADISGFVLQSNTNLLSANWIEIPEPLTNAVMISPTQKCAFFRLVDHTGELRLDRPMDRPATVKSVP